MRYGEALKEWRESKGLTQVEFARCVAVHPQYVSDIERGVRLPGMRVGRSISRVTQGAVGLDLLDEAA